MNKTARKCIWSAAGCFAAAALFMVLYPAVFRALGFDRPPENTFAVETAQVLATMIQWSLFPTGAALIGAAVVINWLTSNASIAKNHKSPSI